VTARQTLELALADIEELIAAHEALTGGGVGAPQNKGGQAISRAAIVILISHIENYVEEAFKEAAVKWYEVAEASELKFLFSQTVDKLNHPSLENINLLFYNLGIMDITKSIRWKKTSNASFVLRYRSLLELRGRVAHGRRPSIRLSVVRKGLRLARQFADCFQRVLDAEFEE
jgi:hypothetical protein